MKEHETKLSGIKPKCQIEDTEDKGRLLEEPSSTLEAASIP